MSRTPRNTPSLANLSPYHTCWAVGIIVTWLSLGAIKHLFKMMSPHVANDVGVLTPVLLALYLRPAPPEFNVEF